MASAATLQNVYNILIFCPILFIFQHSIAYIEVFELLVKFSKIRLETTVEEELEKIKRMEVLAARESKVMTDKASLKKELESEEKTRSKEVQMLRENEQRLAA